MNPIREAAQNLPGHWHQGSNGDGNGNYCGLGHLDKVLNDLNIINGHPMYDLLTEVAREQYPDRTTELYNPMFGGTFADFNDYSETTEDEVIAVMEKAAVRWEEQL